MKMESGGNQEGILLAQVRDNSDEGQCGYNEGGENLSDSRYILKVESTSFANGWLIPRTLAWAARKTELPLTELQKILERACLGMEMKSSIWGMLGLRYPLAIQELSIRYLDIQM